MRILYYIQYIHQGLTNCAYNKRPCASLRTSLLYWAYTLYKSLPLSRIDTPSTSFTSPILSHHFNCSGDCLDGFSQILLFALSSAFTSAQKLLYCVPDGVTLHTV